jgi:hypothetical protein
MQAEEKALPAPGLRRWCVAKGMGAGKGKRRSYQQSASLRPALSSRVSFASGKGRPELNKDERDKVQAIPWQDGWIVGARPTIRVGETLVLSSG